MPMSMLPLPTRRTVLALAGLGLLAAAARIAGAPAGAVAWAGLGGVLGLALLFGGDIALGRRRLGRHPITLTRRLPHALAIGQPQRIGLRLAHEGPWRWQLSLYDHAPQTFRFSGLPLALALPAAAALESGYDVTPNQRGTARFEPAGVRLRMPGGWAELQLRLGQAETLQVYPNFAAVSRYAWLAGDRRLAEIGIKTYQARGSGTDFKQLAEYTAGAPTRHIDWNASMRHRRAVVREFQDDRDQAVMFLLDCGRRMRADERAEGADGSHFDQALNALMLLSYVALKAGDAVGALTFGHPPAEQRHAAPRKGMVALNALVARLHDIEPSPSHSDYLAAARELMLRQPRRSLVVVLTNFRDEDGPELGAALKLLRTRHLVLLASLKERVIGELAALPLADAPAIRTVAAAHLFEQSRRDAFARLAGRDALQVDVEPQALAATLVNRYHAVKRAGLL